MGGGRAHFQKNEKQYNFTTKPLKSVTCCSRTKSKCSRTQQQQQHSHCCLCPHKASKRADIRLSRTFLYSELSHPQVPKHMDTALASWKSGRPYSKLDSSLPPHHHLSPGKADFSESEMIQVCVLCPFRKPTKPGP